MSEINKPIISAKCPKCGQMVKFYSPGHEGIVKLKCPHAECGHVFGVKITEKEIKLGNGGAKKENSHPVTDVVVNKVGTPDGTIARLLQKGKHFFCKDKYYSLRLGDNTIGMFDPTFPSDIMIGGDRTISHRSVTVRVEAFGSTYKYLLTVNKSRNPVFLNGKEIPVGTSLYIQTGQELILGKTRFCLSI